MKVTAIPKTRVEPKMILPPSDVPMKAHQKRRLLVAAQELWDSQAKYPKDPQEAVDKALANGVDLRSVRIIGSDAEMSYLGWAAYHNRTPWIRSLAAAGAEVDWVNNKGRTPLQYVVVRGHIDSMRELIALGADPSCRTPEGKTLLHQAVRCPREYSLQILDELLDLGLDINAVCDAGLNAAHGMGDAGYTVNLHLLQRLFDRGLSVDSRTNDGETVAHILLRAQSPHPPALAELMARGARFDIPGNDGATARDLALRYDIDNPAIALMMRSHEASRAARDFLAEIEKMERSQETAIFDRACPG